MWVGKFGPGQPAGRAASKWKCPGEGEERRGERGGNELPRAEARTWAGPRSVQGMTPGTSILAVQVRCWGLERPRPGRRVASAAPVSRYRVWQEAQGTSSQGRRIPGAGGPSRRTPRAPARTRGGVEPPQPCGAEFDKPRVTSPGALALMHLKQPVLNARVNFTRLRRGAVLFVTVAIVRGDTASALQGVCGLVLHGVLGSRNDVAPEELPFGQGFASWSTKGCAALVGSVEKSA